MAVEALRHPRPCHQGDQRSKTLHNILELGGSETLFAMYENMGHSGERGALVGGARTRETLRWDLQFIHIRDKELVATIDASFGAIVARMRGSNVYRHSRPCQKDCAF